MNYCDKCKSFFYEGSNHVCPPSWYYRFPEYDGADEEFSRFVYANAPHLAAEKAADNNESSYDYEFVNSGGVSVDIKNNDTGEIFNFFVEAETSVNYYAKEKK